MLTAIIVAAGSSRRTGFDKLFATIAEKPVIAHTIHAFERAPSVDKIIVVARQDRRGEVKKIVGDEQFKKVQSIIAGGEHRQDSVRAGLDSLTATTKYVAVHDAARPLITAEQIKRVFEASRKHGAATLAEPVTDTLKRANDFMATGSVDRHQLYAMQTPQVFERTLIEEAYRMIYEKKMSVTDEVSAVEQLGRHVALVINDDFNFKITYPRDLALTELVLTHRAQRPAE